MNEMKSHNHQHALSVFSLRLCGILFRVVNPILNRVGTLGGMTQFLILLQTHFLAFNLVLYTLIFLHFYLRLLSLVCRESTAEAGPEGDERGFEPQSDFKSLIF